MLSGIGEGDWSKIKQIVIEVHDIDGRLDQIRELLEQHGYNLSIEQDIFLQKTGLYNLYAIHPSKAQALEGEKDCRVDARPLLMPKRMPLSTSELRSYLKGTLPEYMVPASFVILDKLPMTPSGKLDRNRFPTPSKLNLTWCMLMRQLAAPQKRSSRIYGRKLLGSSERNLRLVFRSWGALATGDSDHFFRQRDIQSKPAFAHSVRAAHGGWLGRKPSEGNQGWLCSGICADKATPGSAVCAAFIRPTAHLVFRSDGAGQPRI